MLLQDAPPADMLDGTEAAASTDFASPCSPPYLCKPDLLLLNGTDPTAAQEWAGIKGSIQCGWPYLCMPEAQCSCRAHVVIEGLNIHTQRTGSNIVHEALHTADNSMHDNVWRRKAMLWPAVCCYMQRTSGYIVHEAVHTVDEMRNPCDLLLQHAYAVVC